jgi:hypothetical protein
MGEYGYVYKAHLSAFGQLGPVTKRTDRVRRGDRDAGGPDDHSSGIRTTAPRSTRIRS